MPITRARLRLATGCLAVALGCAAARGARAQVIDGYFPAIGTAAGGIPADNSRERIDAEYTPLGLSAGSFRIDPQLRESGGGDSDVNGLGGGGSMLIDSAASVVALSDWARNSLRAEMTVDDRRYASLPRQDSTNWTASLGGTYDVGHDQIGLSYNHLDLVETPNQIGSAVTQQPVPYRVDAIQASYTLASGSRLSLLPGLDVRKYDFDALAIGDTGTNQSWRNRETEEESLVGRYELSPGRNVVVALRGAEIQYDHSLPGLPKLDSQGGSVLAGLDYTADGVFRYRALAGYQRRDYSSGAYKAISAPVAEVSVTWTPTLLTNLVATVRRDIEDSLSESVTGFTYTGVRIDLTHDLRRNVQLGAFVGVQFADSNGAPQAAEGIFATATASNQTITSGGAHATWRLNRTLTLTAAADCRASSGGATRRFTEATGLLTVGLAL